MVTDDDPCYSGSILDLTIPKILHLHRQHRQQQQHEGKENEEIVSDVKGWKRKVVQLTGSDRFSFVICDGTE